MKVFSKNDVCVCASMCTCVCVCACTYVCAAVRVQTVCACKATGGEFCTCEGMYRAKREFFGDLAPTSYENRAKIHPKSTSFLGGFKKIYPPPCLTRGGNFFLGLIIGGGIFF